jgi:SNF2 family DNA or RNA helicase
MLVLHAHWVVPQKPEEPGGVLFWAEDSAAPQPAWHHGRLPQRPRIHPHPYQAPLDRLTNLLRRSSGRDSVTLRLPTTRTGPCPSPSLAHSWTLDAETQPFLAPWTVTGLWMLAQDALPVLLDLPRLERGDRQVVLAEDARYWRIAASVAVEAMAAQKVVPVVARGQSGSALARWQPVLDSPRDAQRLGFLERNMPPVCRAELPANNAARDLPPPSPQALLASFLNGVCDALARQWGWSEVRRPPVQEDQPGLRWLTALFQADPRVKSTPAQIQSLESGFRAWIRNLHLAGDAHFRIAFRLDPPNGVTEDSEEEAPGDAWKLHYLIQARDDPSLLIPADAVWRTSNGGLTQLGRRFEHPQEKLLAGLGYAGRLFPPISDSLKDKTPTHVALDTRQAYTFLRETAPLLEESGFGLLTPPWWNQRSARLGVRLRLRPAPGATPEAIAQGRLSLQKLVEYQWELSLGETSLTEAEFRALAALKTPLVQVRGQWVQLDPEQVESAIQFWEKQRLRGRISLLEAMQMRMRAGEIQGNLPVEEVIAEDWFEDWLERLNQPGRLQQLPQPAGLAGELRPYQRFGYSWLAFCRKWGLGACLADDMGLGKTIQALALLVKEKETLGRFPNPVLLVCPTSVVTNWELETRRFAPVLTTYIHQGPNRKRGEAFQQALGEVDMVLTSYSLVRLDAELLQKVDWHAVILDEAQNIKNPAARQSQVVRGLPSGFRLALTGTPVENRLSELWSIMHFLNPGYLGTREAFRDKFGLPIERYNDQDAARRLREMVSPFILRRVKTDPNVIQDLPEKVETKVYCNLTEEQATLYQAVVEEALAKVEDSNGINRRGNVLSMLMQLKQVCNHPDQYLHQVGQGNGVPTVEQVARSGKLERLVELLEEALAEGDRALIFSQFAEMGMLLSEHLPRALGAPVLFLHGGTSPKSRESMIQRFQEEIHGPPIFVLSLKAGGTGINLTRANHVFHFDRWWNPAVENQATDRAFRIGQHRNVQVHKFITVGTLEEMIDEMIESKKGLAQNIIGSGESWLTELSTSDLRELVELRRS